MAGGASGSKIAPSVEVEGSSFDSFDKFGRFWLVLILALGFWASSPFSWRLFWAWLAFFLGFFLFGPSFSLTLSSKHNFDNHDNPDFTNEEMDEQTDKAKRPYIKKSVKDVTEEFAKI